MYVLMNQISFRRYSVRVFTNERERHRHKDEMKNGTHDLGPAIFSVQRDAFDVT